ncbi:unnamed protein product [Urochloa humidicola]
MDGGDSDENASPMADEQPLPESVLGEAEAEAESPTQPSPHVYMQEFHRVLRLLRHELPGSDVLVMVRIARDGISTWYADGQPMVDDDAYANGVPASEEVMAALPETTTVGEGETTKECAYEAGDVLRTMPCSHGFHESCIFQWLRVSRLCPLCRFAMSPAAGKQSRYRSWARKMMPAMTMAKKNRV